MAKWSASVGLHDANPIVYSCNEENPEDESFFEQFC